MECTPKARDDTYADSYSGSDTSSGETPPENPSRIASSSEPPIIIRIPIPQRGRAILQTLEPPPGPGAIVPFVAPPPPPPASSPTPSSRPYSTAGTSKKAIEGCTSTSPLEAEHCGITRDLTLSEDGGATNSPKLFFSSGERNPR